MSIRIFLVAVIGHLVACCEFAPNRGDQIRPEEYAVLAAVIDTVYATGYLELPTLVLLTERTISCPPSEGGIRSRWPYRVYKPGVPDPDGFVVSESDSKEFMLKSLQSDVPELNWPSLLRDFDSVAVHTAQIDSSSLTLSRRVILLPADTTQDGSSSGTGLEGLLQQRDAGGLASVSRVGLDGTRTQAILYYHESTDGARSMYFVLRKEAGRWIVLRGRGWVNL
jgi:hypothetical protein